MTAASVTGLGAGEQMPVNDRPRHPAHPRAQEWKSVYQRELLRRRDRAPEEHLVGQGGLSASPGRRSDSQHGSRRLRAVVIAVGGHLELRLVAGSGTAMLDLAAAEALARGDSHGSSAPPPGLPASGFAAGFDAGHGPRWAAPTEGAFGPRPPIALAKPDAQRDGAGENSASRVLDGAQAMDGIPAGAAAFTLGALACTPVSATDAASDTSEHADRETAVALATALKLAASRASAAAAPSSGASERRGQRSPDPHSGSEHTAAGGSVIPAGRSHGTFPLIVSGQLLELEFVSLDTAADPARGAAQQIVIGVQPPGMPRVELTARKLDGKVVVALSGATGAETRIPRGALDLPALLHRLGWGSLPVEFTSEPVVAIGAGASR